MPRRIIRTITTAIAIAALAAPTALARPDSMPPTAAQAKQSQNARSADAATASAASDYPTRPGQGEQAIPRPETPPQASADPSVAWGMIGLGIAGLLIIAAIAAVASRTRRSARTRTAA